MFFNMIRLMPSGANINALAQSCHADNVRAGWWSDRKTGADLRFLPANDRTRNVGELLILIVSELAEGADGLDGDLKDDKLPHRMMIEVELGDTCIRIFDLAGAKNSNLGALTDLDFVRRTALDKVADAHNAQDALWRIARFAAAAMEGDRKAKTMEIDMGDSVTQVLVFDYNLALMLCGIYWLADALGLDLAGAIAEKRAFNAIRPDHKLENRAKEGGKAY